MIRYKGGIPLVSTECYNVSHNIMKKIRNETSFQVLGKEGRSLLIIIDEKMEDDLRLQNQFIECNNSVNIANEMKLKFKALIKQYTDSMTGQYAKKFYCFPWSFLKNNG